MNVIRIVIRSTVIAGTSATVGARIERRWLSPVRGPRIEITIAEDARAEATTGMVYVAISRDNKRTPIDQAAPTGAPLFSIAIDNAAVRHARSPSPLPSAAIRSPA